MNIQVLRSAFEKLTSCLKYSLLKSRCIALKWCLLWIVKFMCYVTNIDWRNGKHIYCK